MGKYSLYWFTAGNIVCIHILLYYASFNIMVVANWKWKIYRKIVLLVTRLLQYKLNKLSSLILHFSFIDHFLRYSEFCKECVGFNMMCVFLSKCNNNIFFKNALIFTLIQTLWYFLLFALFTWYFTSSFFEIVSILKILVSIVIFLNFFNKLCTNYKI